MKRSGIAILALIILGIYPSVAQVSDSSAANFDVRPRHLVSVSPLYLINVFPTILLNYETRLSNTFNVSLGVGVVYKNEQSNDFFSRATGGDNTRGFKINQELKYYFDRKNNHEYFFSIVTQYFNIRYDLNQYIRYDCYNNSFDFDYTYVQYDEYTFKEEFFRAGYKVGLLSAIGKLFSIEYGFGGLIDFRVYSNTHKPDNFAAQCQRAIGDDEGEQGARFTPVMHFRLGYRIK